MSDVACPTPVLDAARVRLRPYTVADEDAFVELFQDDEVARFVGDGPQPESEDRALFHRVFSHVYEPQRFAVWGVEIGGELVGHAEVKPSPSAHVDGWELIYVLRRSHWRQGYGREIATAITRFALDELALPDLFATVDARNAASIGLLEGIAYTQVDDYDENDHSVLVFRTDAAPS